jgi:phosphatidate cytidylyltransferase
MKNRILFGTIMIAAVVGLFLLDGWLEHKATGAAARRAIDEPGARPLIALPLALVVLALLLMGFLEVTRICASVRIMLLRVSGMIGSLMLGTLPFWWQWVSAQPPLAAHALLLIGLIVLLVFAEQMLRCRTDDAIAQLGATFLAVLYLGIGAALILHIRLAYGLGEMIIFLAAVKCTDIGAYFTGSAIGKHKLIPWLSPGKSWEGLAGGIAIAAGIAALGTWALSLLGSPIWSPGGLAVWEGAVFGAVVGLAGQFADLCESLLKRSAEIKDSGALVPDFGGILDILDSPLLSAPIALVMLQWLA